MAHLVTRRQALFALATSLQFIASTALAEGATEETVTERRVKAAYLYRFASYVDWPEALLPRPDSPLVIGIWGNDDLAEDLATLVARRTVGERRVEVRRPRDAAALAGMHILFIGQARAARLGEALGSLGPHSVLLVTESPGALKQGSVINFLMDDGQIRFEISLEAAEKRGLKLSSRLIAVSYNLSGKAR